MKKYLLSELEDNGTIVLGRGQIISKNDMNDCPGSFPVYSSSASGNGEFGRYGKYMFDDERITWSIDGGGRLFYRHPHKYSVTNVCGWMVVAKKDLLDTKYLYYCLINQWQHLVFDYTFKAHPSKIRDIYYVSIPPIEEQRKIVDILDKVSNAISMCEEEYLLCKEIIKSKYIEMFGHPETNPLNWNKKHFSELGQVIGGYAFDSQKFSKEGIPVLRIGNINSGFFKNDNLVFWPYDSKLIRFEIHPDDLVISLTGTVGKNDYANVCILGDNYPLYYLNQRNAKLVVGNKLNKIYFKEHLAFDEIKGKLTNISRGQRQANLSNNDILDMVIPLPPIELQNEFEAFVKKIGDLELNIKERHAYLSEYQNKKMSEFFED